MATFGELSEKPSSVNFAISFQNGDMSFNDGGKTMFCTGYDKLVQDIDRSLKTHYNEATNEGNKVYATLEVIDQYDEGSILSLIESDFRDALIRLKAAQYTSSLPDEQIRSIESVKASYYNGDYTTVLVNMSILNGLAQSVSLKSLVLTRDLTIRHLYEEV